MKTEYDMKHQANIRIATLSALLVLGAGATLAQGPDRAAFFATLDADGNGSLTRAERMIERLDTDNDARLSRAELLSRHDPARVFARLDADADGAVTAEEFAQGHARGKGHGRRHQAD